MAARRQAGIRASWKAGAVRSPLGLADDLVGEVGEAVTDGPGRMSGSSWNLGGRSWTV
jgi:hypothetical protein